MHQPAILIDRLAVGYRRRGQTHIVADALSATAAAGSVTALIGRNGTGKSTLLRTLAALQPAMGGHIRIAGSDPTVLTPTQAARCVAVVLTERIDTDGLTAEEVVAMGRMPYTPLDGRLRAADRDIVERALHVTEVDTLRRRNICRLSDGERQRVMIAKALAQTTPVILLDEPTAFLDFPAKVETMRLLRRLSRNEGKAILLSTHDLSIALPLADRAWLLTPSGITAGAPRRLAEDGTLGRHFETDGIALDARTMQFSFSISREENLP